MKYNLTLSPPETGPYSDIKNEGIAYVYKIYRNSIYFVWQNNTCKGIKPNIYRLENFMTPAASTLQYTLAASAIYKRYKC